jgi:rhomboid family GlyGly-CTERM serine protease
MTSRYLSKASRIAITLAISVAATLIATCEPVAGLLTFDRQAIVERQWWRFVTGHLVHWNFRHYFFDVLMFAVLGAICERRSRATFVGCLAASALTISTAIWWTAPEMRYYRGLSGIDSALFTLAAAGLLQAAWQRGDRQMVSLIACSAVGFIAKLGYEIVSRETFFVDSVAADFTPLPVTHAVGAVVGVAAFMLFNHAQPLGSEAAVLQESSQIVRGAVDH